MKYLRWVNTILLWIVVIYLFLAFRTYINYNEGVTDGLIDAVNMPTARVDRT